MKKNYLLYLGILIVIGSVVALSGCTTPATDNTTPTITSSDPTNFATNVTRDKNITVTFSEPIKAGDLNKIVLQTSNGTKITTTKSINGSTLTITHSTLLAPKTFYKLFLNTGSITDLAGNPLQTKVLGFTTRA
jgi:methionine-rich copper-binding protein CopC